MKLIDKDAVVAEIKSYIDGFCDRNGYLEDAETNGIAYETLCDLKDSIDTLEEKEGVLDEEGKTKLMKKCVHKAYKRGYHMGVLKTISEMNHKEVIAEQECTCNEPLNRIIGGSWNLLCPVNKLGLKNGDKVKIIIKAQKGE